MVTTDSKHKHPVAPNGLNRGFDVDEVQTLNQCWVSDITFIPIRARNGARSWLYLAVVLDLKSRRVIGWSMKESLHQSLVGEALLMAQKARLAGPVQGRLLFHSDRGSQYAARATQEWLQQWQIVPSMSRAGNCWDNAVAESFFATLKKELVHREHFETPEQARASLFFYIEVFYNKHRRHSALGYISPYDYEQTLLSRSPHYRGKTNANETARRDPSVAEAPSRMTKERGVERVEQAQKLSAPLRDVPVFL